MIVQVRGTSGSGKTWVMRETMKRLSNSWEPVYIEKRKKPVRYLYRIPSVGSITVLGHYESACGGCDNVGSARAVYELIESIQSETQIILCEGLLLSEDVKWTTQFSFLDPKIVFLSTDVETCVSQILERRKAAGNTKELNENNTRNRVQVIERARLKLTDSGIICLRKSPRQAVDKILEWIHAK